MLLTAVFVLLLGIVALLGVAYQRHQRLRDTTIDLQRNLTQRESKIAELKTKLENCDTVQAVTPVDTSWGAQNSSLPPAKADNPAASSGW